MGEASTALILGALATVVVQLVTFATIVFNARTQRLRAEQARQWEVEDREIVAAKVVTASEKLAETVQIQHLDLTSKITENTEKTEQAATAAKEAYHEANTINLKLEKLGLEHNRLDKEKVEIKKQGNQ